MINQFSLRSAAETFKMEGAGGMRRNYFILFTNSGYMKYLIIMTKYGIPVIPILVQYFLAK
jgi:hypothetical protein